MDQEAWLHNCLDQQACQAVTDRRAAQDANASDCIDHIRKLSWISPQLSKMPKLPKTVAPAVLPGTTQLAGLGEAADQHEPFKIANTWMNNAT